MKRIIYIIAAIVVIAVLSVAAYAIYTKPFIENSSYCNVDSDCAIRFSSCSCANSCVNSFSLGGYDCARACQIGESDKSVHSCECVNKKCVPGEDSLAPWDSAINILRSGEVAQAHQTHSLYVTLILKNASKIITKEPHIDDIFDEIDKCGLPCSSTVVATE